MGCRSSSIDICRDDSTFYSMNLRIKEENNVFATITTIISSVFFSPIVFCSGRNFKTGTDGDRSPRSCPKVT